MYCVFRLWYF